MPSHTKSSDRIVPQQVLITDEMIDQAKEPTQSRFDQLIAQRGPSTPSDFADDFRRGNRSKKLTILIPELLENPIWVKKKLTHYSFWVDGVD